MKKLIFTIFLLSSLLVYSQDEMPTMKPSKFHHTLGLNLSPTMLGGYKVDLMFGGQYDVPFGGKHFLNFIPYYELNYNNKIFLTANYRYGNIRYSKNADMYYLILSYNFLKSTSSHSLKLGAGGVYFKSNKGGVLYFNSGKDYNISYALALSYHYRINKHLGAGIGIDYSHLSATTEMGDNGSIEESFAIGHLYLKLSYTF